jgi:transitional endoplasmic reticulum ATPase
MNDFFKGFEQLLELAKTLEEKGELKTDIRINSRSFSSIPRQGNIPNDIGVTRMRSPGSAEGSDSADDVISESVIITPPPSDGCE